MSLGNSLYQARKNSGLSQEEAAERLNVSRQTVSKWETEETLPDIRQLQKMAVLYRLSLDQLTDFDPEIQQIRQAIRQTSQNPREDIDWTALWAEQYPVLASYPQQVEVEAYARPLRRLLEQLKADYGYSDQDALLVLKDILAQTQACAWRRNPC